MLIAIRKLSEHVSTPCTTKLPQKDMLIGGSNLKHELIVFTCQQSTRFRLMAKSDNTIQI